MSQKDTQDKLQKLNLMDNARDSLYHAVGHITEGGIDDLANIKRAIIDIFHAMELLLKERLRQIRPALVCRDIDKPLLDYAKTVNVNVALNRLSHLDNKPSLKPMGQTIKRCNEIRNDIMHYEFQIKVEEAKAILGKMTSLVFRFSKDILNVDLEHELRSDKRWLALAELSDFWDEQSRVINEKLIKSGVEIKLCPYCGKYTFNVSKGMCDLCGHDDTLLKCHICEKVIWRGKSESLDIPTEECDPMGGPICERVDVCEKCYLEAIGEEIADYYADKEFD